LWNNDLKGRLVNSISMDVAEEAAKERFAQVCAAIVKVCESED
jgi:hypothetical protein